MPNTVDEWLDVSGQRAKDAEKLLELGSGSVGCVYMAGYVLECNLKAYYREKGMRIPRGPDGHNLRRLWGACGHPMRDLKINDEFSSFFIERWSTDLRYETQLPIDYENNAKDLLDAARKLSGIVRCWIRRYRSSRR